MTKGTIIVGAGRGLAFAKFLNTHHRDRNRNVLALVDINSTVHGKVRRRLDSYGATETLVLTTLTEALERFSPKEADSVMILASNKAHAELTLEALAADRHVFLEKPIAADWKDATTIARAAVETDKIVQLGFVLRYSAYYRKIREIAESGALGRLVMIQINERLDLGHSNTYRRAWRRKHANTGGFLNEKCCHDLDVICWMKKGQAVPVDVFSYGGMELFPDKSEAPEKCVDCPDDTCPFRRDLKKLANLEFDLSIDLDLQATCVYKTDADVLNHQSVVIRFSDGTQAVFTITAYSGDSDRDIIIHGTEGCLVGKLNEGEFHWDNYRAKSREEFSTGIINDQHGGGEHRLIPEFFECVDTGASPAATVADGLVSSQIAFAADLSVSEGRKVALSEFDIETSHR